MNDFSKSCSVVLATLLLIGCNPDEELVDSSIEAPADETDIGFSCEDATATEITALGASTIKYTFSEDECLGENSSSYTTAIIPVTNIGASNPIELVSDLGIARDAYFSIAATNTSAVTQCSIQLTEMRIYDPSDELIVTLESDYLSGSSEVIRNYTFSECLRPGEIGYFLDIDIDLDFPDDKTGWYAEITDISSSGEEADIITSFTGVDLTSTDSIASARFQLNGSVDRDLDDFSKFVFLDETGQPIGWTFASPNSYSVVLDQLEIGIIEDDYGFRGLAKSVVLIIDYEVTTVTATTSLGVRSGQAFASQKERDMAIKEVLSNRK